MFYTVGGAVFVFSESTMVHKSCMSNYVAEKSVTYSLVVFLNLFSLGHNFDPDKRWISPLTFYCCGGKIWKNFGG